MEISGVGSKSFPVWGLYSVKTDKAWRMALLRGLKYDRTQERRRGPGGGKRFYCLIAMYTF